MNNLRDTVTLTPEGDDIPSDEVFSQERHTLRARADAANRDIILEFSTRESMYEFAKALLQEAVYGRGGEMECYPLAENGRKMVVNGVRLTEDSSRIFVFYPDKAPDSRPG